VNTRTGGALALARVALLALFLSLSACGGSNDGQQLTVSGAVDRPSTPTVSDLQAQSATTQTVSFSAAGAPQTHTYTGTSLWGLLNGAGIQLDATRKNDVLTKVVLATGADGYKAVFSLGESDPDFGNRASIVAYAETIAGLPVALTGDGPFRVTSPGDVKGGRYVSSLVRLDVRASGSTVATVGGGVSTQFAVSGAVQRPGSYDLAALQALPVGALRLEPDQHRGLRRRALTLLAPTWRHTLPQPLWRVDASSRYWCQNDNLTPATRCANLD
jgi:hypothetical protein